MLRVAIGLYCVAFLSACGLAQKAPDAATPLAGCGDENASYSVSRGPVGDSVAMPAADTATVYIVELYNLRDKGKFNRPTIRQGLDGAWLGATQGFTYVSASVKPGVHHLCSRWQSAFGTLSQQISLNDFEAVAGKRYYFRVQINIEGSAGDAAGPASIDLQQVSEDEGRFLVSEAAQSVSKLKK